MRQEINNRVAALTPSQDIKWTFAAGAAALLAGIALRQVLQEGWKAATEEEPPTNPAAPDVSWTEALSWAAISGITVALGRVVARRGVAGVWKRSSGGTAETWEAEKVV